MTAWLLDRLGGALELKDAPIPEPRPGGVVLRIEASALMSYLKAYVEGRLPIYNPPRAPSPPVATPSESSMRSAPRSII
jgi:alcohol dehydrogenase